MIVGKAGDEAAIATARYERLRGEVLAGIKGGGLGLIVLMREGVAAWLAQTPTRSTTITSIKDSIAVPPIVPGDVHADMIRVLATMAMAISPEVHA
jgi:hypothetical protein